LDFCGAIFLAGHFAGYFPVLSPASLSKKPNEEGMQPEKKKNKIFWYPTQKKNPARAGWPGPRLGLVRATP